MVTLPPAPKDDSQDCWLPRGVWQYWTLNLRPVLARQALDLRAKPPFYTTGGTALREDSGGLDSQICKDFLFWS